MNRVFIDMDGVIVDFEGTMRERGMTGDEVKQLPDGYSLMRPIAGALDAVRSIISMGFEVWIATKPPTGVAHAYAQKAAWVLEHLPELKRRIVITHDKGMLGDEFDFLIDDRPHKANCDKFAGTFIPFCDPTAAAYRENLTTMAWPEVLDFLRAASPQLHRKTVDFSDTVAAFR